MARGQKTLDEFDLAHFLKCECGADRAVGDTGLSCTKCDRPIFIPRIEDRKNSEVMRRLRALYPHHVVDHKRSNEFDPLKKPKLEKPKPGEPW